MVSLVKSQTCRFTNLFLTNRSVKLLDNVVCKNILIFLYFCFTISLLLVPCMKSFVIKSSNLRGNYVSQIDSREIYVDFACS